MPSRAGGLGYPWTQPYNDTQTRLEWALASYASGESAANIGKALGRKFPETPPTRNAVLGKLYRAGAMASHGTRLPGKRATPQQRAAMVASAPAVRQVAAPTVERDRGNNAATAHKTRSAIANQAVRPQLATNDGQALVALSAHACKWPIGDPMLDGFTFCGCQQQAGKQYCPKHCAAAYEPLAPSKRGQALAHSLRRYL